MFAAGWYRSKQVYIARMVLCILCTIALHHGGRPTGSVQMNKCVQQWSQQLPFLPGIFVSISSVTQSDAGYGSYCSLAQTCRTEGMGVAHTHASIDPV